MEARVRGWIYGLLKTSLYPGQTQPQGESVAELQFCVPHLCARTGLPAWILPEWQLAGTTLPLSHVWQHLGSEVLLSFLKDSKFH